MGLGHFSLGQSCPSVQCYTRCYVARSSVARRCGTRSNLARSNVTQPFWVFPQTSSKNLFWGNLEFVFWVFRGRLPKIKRAG